MPDPQGCLEQLASRWHTGWLASRRYGATVAADGTVRARVGEENREVELLVPDGDRDGRRLDRACQQVLAERRCWLTVVTGDPGRTGDRVVEHGLRVLAHAETLMSVDLAVQAPAPVPAEHEVVLEVGHRALRVRLLTPSGLVAATGQAGLDGDLCVPDRILVQPVHRRRGLGAAVMTALVAAALDHGAARGLLVASPDGRRLYEALGWRRVADVLVADQG